MAPAQLIVDFPPPPFEPGAFPSPRSDPIAISLIFHLQPAFKPASLGCGNRSAHAAILSGSGLDGGLPELAFSIPQTQRRTHSLFILHITQSTIPMHAADAFPETGSAVFGYPFRLAVLGQYFPPRHFPCWGWRASAMRSILQYMYARLPPCHPLISCSPSSPFRISFERCSVALVLLQISALGVSDTIALIPILPPTLASIPICVRKDLVIRSQCINSIVSGSFLAQLTPLSHD
jgi:hypothetical protein